MILSFLGLSTFSGENSLLNFQGNSAPIFGQPQSWEKPAWVEFQLLVERSFFVGHPPFFCSLEPVKQYVGGTRPLWVIFVFLFCNWLDGSEQIQDMQKNIGFWDVF